MIHKNIASLTAMLSGWLVGCSAAGPESAGSQSESVIAVDGSVCIQNVLCIAGDHFDRVLCRCVPNDAGAGACISKEDGPCGGFTTHPCRCAAGLRCVPNRIPDIPGVCEDREDASAERCCPNGWDLFSCHEEDGTSGLNCRNPQLACPTSTVCGAGCNFEVERRCPVCDPLPCPPEESFSLKLCRCVPTL